MSSASKDGIKARMNAPALTRNESTPSAGGESAWQWLEPAGDLKAFAESARSALTGVEFQHDPQWMAIAHPGPDERLVSLVSNGRHGLQGLLLGHLSANVFEYTLAGRGLLRRKVNQLTLHQGPLLSNSAPASSFTDCLAELARRMPPEALVYCSATPVGSPFHQVLAQPSDDVRRAFHVLPWGGEAMHAKIRWEGTVDAYLKSLDAKRRGNVKRPWQKLKSSSTNHRLRRFHAPGEVDEFIRLAADIYAGSDRGAEQDLGPAPTAGREALIHFAASQNAFLGWIFYLDERPVAYRYGYLYGKTLFAISTAYDQGQSEHRPGAVIFFDMLQDLEAAKTPIDLIDLLPHESGFKRDRANLLTPTQNFFLLPKTLSGRALYGMVSALEAGKPLAGRLLQGVRKVLKL